MLKRARDSYLYRTSLLRQNIRLRKNRSGARITIFGSCRQDSLARYFKVTTIRDGLTFPHYSKEIIQAIEYCRTAGNISPSTHKVFRNSLLNLKLQDPDKLKRDFDSTDVFVVEIASLIEYRKNDDYYHHIAAESIDGIRKVNQTYESLEEDIVRIHNLLSPKKVLFVTHFSTKSSGVRFELSNFIEDTCKSHGFEVMNPSRMNLNWDSRDLHLDEAIISHFSPMGHEIMADRFREKISTLHYSANLTPLVQKYTPGIVVDDYHGLGDFIYGSIRMHQEAISFNRPSNIDISDHPMSEFLESEFSTASKSVTPIVAESQSFNFENSETIFTHLRPIRSVSVADCDFVLRNALTPRKDFLEMIKKYKSDLGIEDPPYSVVHVRMGDEFIESNKTIGTPNQNPVFIAILRYVEKLPDTEKYFISTDSKDLSQYLSEKGLDLLPGSVAHFGLENPDRSALRDTLFQFFTLKDAENIHQISSYGWGSGFSETAAVLGRKKLIKIGIRDLL